jgi:hypothetical protein
MIFALWAFKNLTFFITSFETSISKPTLAARSGLLEEGVSVFEMDAIGSSENSMRKPEVTRVDLLKAEVSTN